MKEKHRDVSIHQLSESDLPELLEIENLCFSVPWSNQMFLEELDNDKAIYLIAKKNNKVVGYCGVWVILDEGHITNIAVHPNYQRQGIAQYIIEKILCEIQKRDIKDITLEVRKSNISAIRLYEKNQFYIAGIRKKYYQDNKEDALIMWCRLN